jgi:hypothetical protein
MKKEEQYSRSAMDCSVKWRNMKRVYLQLCVPGTDPKERIRWPYMESMEKLMANNPTVTLEHVTDVVDSVKKRVNTSFYNVQTHIAITSM